MMTHSAPLPWRLILGLPLVKGATLVSVLSALDVTFVKQLVITAVSAILSGMFLLISTWWLTHHQRKNLERPLADVQRKLGAGRRATDNGISDG